MPMTSKPLFASLRTMSAVDAAQRLLGCELVREIGGKTIRVRIVETEAYDQTDAASHSYKGRTARTEVMFGPAGHLYVYFTYGMHFCCNIVVGEAGYSAAVLVRAVEPIEGEEIMRGLRDKPGVALSNGPAKLCQALQIDTDLNGHNMTKSPLKLIEQPTVAPADIVTTTRIGISQAKEEPWRFYIRDNAYISKR